MQKKKSSEEDTTTALAVPEAAFYAHPRVIDLTNRTRSFQECAAIISACHGFIGVDSGPQHVSEPNAASIK